MIIKDESELAKKVFDYYNKHLVRISGEKQYNDKFKDILKYINWKLVDNYNETRNKYKDLEFPIENDTDNNEYKRIYINIPAYSNPYINDFLIKYSVDTGEEITILEEERKLLYESNIMLYINEILSSKEIRFVIIILITIVDLNLKYTSILFYLVPTNVRNVLLNKLLSVYKTIDNKSMKLSIPKALIIIIDSSIIKYIFRSISS